MGFGDPQPLGKDSDRVAHSTPVKQELVIGDGRKVIFGIEFGSMVDSIDSKHVENLESIVMRRAMRISNICLKSCPLARTFAHWSDRSLEAIIDIVDRLLLFDNLGCDPNVANDLEQFDTFGELLSSSDFRRGFGTRGCIGNQRPKLGTKGREARVDVHFGVVTTKVGQGFGGYIWRLRDIIPKNFEDLFTFSDLGLADLTDGEFGDVDVEECESTAHQLLAAKHFDQALDTGVESRDCSRQRCWWLNDNLGLFEFNFYIFALLLDEWINAPSITSLFMVSFTEGLNSLMLLGKGLASVSANFSCATITSPYVVVGGELDELDDVELVLVALDVGLIEGAGIVFKNRCPGNPAILVDDGHC